MYVDVRQIRPNQAKFGPDQACSGQKQGLSPALGYQSQLDPDLLAPNRAATRCRRYLHVCKGASTCM